MATGMVCTNVEPQVSPKGNTAFCVLRTEASSTAVQPAAGGALRESPRGGAPSEKPAAPRRPNEEHRASRRGPYPDDGLERTQVFRLLCALVRAELRAHPQLNFGAGYTDLVEHLKCAAARAQLPYEHDHLRRAMDAIERTLKARRPKPMPEAPRVHWRDRCAHTPRCTTPTQCALRADREGA
jgi:hypothetical protein